jgi:hypothetical protein
MYFFETTLEMIYTLIECLFSTEYNSGKLCNLVKQKQTEQQQSAIFALNKPQRIENIILLYASITPVN